MGMTLNYFEWFMVVSCVPKLDEAVIAACDNMVQFVGIIVEITHKLSMSFRNGKGFPVDRN